MPSFPRSRGCEVARAGASGVKALGPGQKPVVIDFECNNRMGVLGKTPGHLGFCS